jgi:3-methyladenine DNA glycosylase AlkD
MSVKKIKAELRKHASPRKAKLLQRFFKTGPGEYAEGDIFLGINVPTVRRLAKQYADLSLAETLKLLRSAIHEERLLALLILILQYRQADPARKKAIYEVYLRNTRHINNWDLVDVTAKHIVGAYLADKARAPLYALAKSGSLWERRIAILSTFHFIEHNDHRDTLKIAEILISDPHDLIHKAVGWMLREVGKRDIDAEERFLRKYGAKMPRTMLRYAIERFPELKRRVYLRSKII